MAAANLQILRSDCLKTYGDSMRFLLNATESFLSAEGLQQEHDKSKNESISKVSLSKISPFLITQFHIVNILTDVDCNQFQGEKKLGGQDLISEFQRKLEEEIESKYNDFKQENNNKKKQFEVSLKIPVRISIKIEVDF